MIALIYRFHAKVPDFVEHYLQENGKEKEMEDALDRATVGRTHWETDRNASTLHIFEFNHLGYAKEAEAAVNRVIDSYTRLAVAIS